MTTYCSPACHQFRVSAFARILTLAIAIFTTSNLCAQCDVTSLQDNFSGGTLREVIGSCPAGGTVTFSVAGTINLVEQGWNYSSLGIEKNLTIDGGGQITIVGGTESSAGPTVADHIFSVGYNGSGDPSGTTIQGFTLIGAKSGIAIGNGSNITIEDNYIGTTPAGDCGAGFGHEEHGIIYYSAVAGPVYIRNNTISGNGWNGIHLQGVDGGEISGNKVGVDPTGTACCGNQWDGIHIIDTDNLTIGGPTAAERNIIGCNGEGEDPESFNGKRGLYIQDSDNNTIQNNHIGTGITGTETTVGNYHSGIELSSFGGDGSDGNTIIDNVISGNGRNAVTTPGSPTNSQHGIVITKGGDNNEIYSNAIGLSATGNALPNLRNGIEIGGSAGNILGAVGQANTIGNNGNIGVIIQNGANNNTVSSNFIGTDAAGNDHGNQTHGIQLSTFDNGVDPVQPLVGNAITDNIISFNVEYGIQAAGDDRIDGIVISDNTVGLLPNGTNGGAGNGRSGIIIQTDLDQLVVQDNLVGANGGDGIELSPDVVTTGANNRLLGNIVGVDINGAVAANTRSGINVNTNTGNVAIGGTGVGEGNTIAGNGQNGIIVNGTDVNNISMLNNTIGLNQLGAVVSNQNYGVHVLTGTNLTVGDAGANGGNLVSGNTLGGIFLEGGNIIDVFGNTVGLDATQTTIIGNGPDASGIMLSGATNVDIGTVGSGNVVSGNEGHGIEIIGTNGTITVVANLVGTDGTGNAVLANGDGDATFDGISVLSSSDLTIGGLTAAEGNVVGGHAGNGIEVNGSSDVTVSANRIGIGLDGTSNIGNQNSGVSVVGSIDVTIGGATFGEKNFIGFNGGGGSGEENGVTTYNVVNFTVQGNNIGLDENGDAAGNVNNGIIINGATAAQTTNVTVADNTIGANTNRAIWSGNVDGMTVTGNTFGANATGDNHPHGLSDVTIDLNSTNVTIGGALGSGDENTFYGSSPLNVQVTGDASIVAITGNFMGTNSFQTTTQTATTNAVLIEGNADQVSVGGAGALSNVIMLDNSATSGVLIQGDATNTAVDGNYIGVTEVTGGVNSLGISMGDGIQVTGNASNTTIGTSQGNTIGGTASHGIYLNGIAVNNTTIENNNIGVDDTGADGVGLSIDGQGIYVLGSTNTSVTANTVGNVQGINNGILVADVTTGTTSLDGNYVGINAADALLNNGGNGITVRNTSATTTIGTTTGNVVSGNGFDGININGSSNVIIEQNLIGTDNAGSTALGNGVGNGISINNGSSNVTVQNGNVIGGNSNGINVNNASTNDIQGNYIGVSADGVTDIGNTGIGISIVNGSSSNTIGGTSTNFIAYNNAGSSIDGATSDFNTFSQNSWFCNDAGDNGGNILVSDGNDNVGVSFGVASLSANIKPDDLGAGMSSFNVEGAGLPVGATVEIYEKDANCDNCRQGMTYVGAATVDGAGDVTGFNVGAVGGVNDCEKYTFTVTDLNGNTSEFSTCSECACVAIPAVYLPVPADTIVNCVGDGNTQIFADSSAGAAIAWFEYDGTTGTATGNTSGNTTSQDPGVGDTTGYYFTIDNAGCVTTSDTITIVYNDPPVVSVGLDTAVCSGVALDISGMLTPPSSSFTSSLAWTHNGNGSFDNSTGLSPTYTPDPLDDGNVVTLTLTGTGNTPCATDVASLDLAVRIPPSVDAGSDETTCAGSPWDLATSTTIPSVTNESSLSWAVTTGSGTLDDNTIIDPTYSPVAADGGTVVRLTVTANGMGACPSATDFMDLTVVSSAVIDAGGPAQLFCGVQDLNLATITTPPSEDGSAISIAWTHDGNGSFSDPSILAPIYQADPADAGNTVRLTLTVDGPVPGPCQTVTDFVEVTYDIQPQFVSDGDVSVCAGDAVNFSGTLTNATGLVWSAGSGSGSIADQNSASTSYQSVIGDAGTQVVLTGTIDPNGACLAASANVTVTINALPNPAISGATNVCENTTAETYGLTSPNATSSYVWSQVGGTNITAALDGLSADVDFGAASVVVSVVETDGNLCTGSADYNVTIDPVQNQSITISNDGPKCAGEPVTFTSNLIGGGTSATYFWTINGVGQTNSGSDFTSVFADGDLVQVSVTSLMTCPVTGENPALSNEDEVNYFDTPDASIDAGADICVGSSATLTAFDLAGVAGSITYQWYKDGVIMTGEANSSLIVSQEGNYTVEMDNGGCSDLSSPQIVNITDPSLAIIADEPDLFIELGDNVVLTGVGSNALGAETISDFVLDWTELGTSIGTSSSVSVAPTLTTDYVLSGTLNGCPAEAEITIKVFRPIQPPNVITPPKSGEDGDDMNDWWHLDGIETHPDAIIKVFNRWGNIVYTHEGGDTYEELPFDGTRNGNDLPVATYYYVIELHTKGGQEPMAGAVSIIR